MSFNTPILFIIYNRPELTARSFERISALRPKRLFVSGDGYSHNKQDDVNRVQAARQIVKDISWPCEVQYNFYDQNKGCKIAVSSAIDWFFSHVEEGIIIEDDIIPSNSFFEFANDMLQKHKDTETVMHISGNSFIPRPLPNLESYYFSSIPHIWGWATWKRAWSKYSVDMNSFEENMDFPHIHSNTIKEYFHRHFIRCKKNEIDTWDYQWGYTLWANEGLSITPAVNLIKNIGFGPEATHTKGRNPRLEKMMDGDMKMPYIPPRHLAIDHKLDEEMFQNHFMAGSERANFVKRVINRLIPRI